MTARKAPPHAWKPGQSGNPAGKPRGSGAVAKLRAAIGEHLQEILGELIQRAKAGDLGAARILIDRVLPPLKAESAPQAVEIPPGGLREQGEAILRAVADARIGIHEGCALLGALGTHARIVEVAELEARIAALEEAAAGRD